MAVFFKQLIAGACGCPSESCVEEAAVKIKVGFGRPLLGTAYKYTIPANVLPWTDPGTLFPYETHTTGIFNGYQPNSPMMHFYAFNQITQVYDLIKSHRWTGFVESWNTATADKQPFGYKIPVPSGYNPGLYTIRVQSTDPIPGEAYSDFYGDPFDTTKPDGWARDFYAVYDMMLPRKYLTTDNKIAARFSIDESAFGGTVGDYREYAIQLHIAVYGQPFNDFTSSKLTLSGKEYNATTYEYRLTGDPADCLQTSTICWSTGQPIHYEDTCGNSFDYPNASCPPGVSQSTIETSGNILLTGL
jgi:hypothetical protein